MLWTTRSRIISVITVCLWQKNQWVLIAVIVLSLFKNLRFFPSLKFSSLILTWTHAVRYLTLLIKDTIQLWCLRVMLPMTFLIIKSQTKFFNQLLSKFCGKLLGTELYQSGRHSPYLHIWTAAKHKKPYWEGSLLVRSRGGYILPYYFFVILLNYMSLNS